MAVLSVSLLVLGLGSCVFQFRFPILDSKSYFYFMKYQHKGLYTHSILFQMKKYVLANKMVLKFGVDLSYTKEIMHNFGSMA